MSELNAPAFLPLQLFAKLPAAAPWALVFLMPQLGDADWPIWHAGVAAVARGYRPAIFLHKKFQPRLLAARIDGMLAIDKVGLPNRCAQAVGSPNDSILPLLQHRLLRAQLGEKKRLTAALFVLGVLRLRISLEQRLATKLKALAAGQSDSNMHTSLVDSHGQAASPKAQALCVALSKALQATLHTLGVWRAELPVEPLLTLLPITRPHGALYPSFGLTQHENPITNLMQASPLDLGTIARAALVALAGLWTAIRPAANAQMRSCLDNCIPLEACCVWAEDCGFGAAVVGAWRRLLGLCDCRAIIAPILQVCVDRGEARAGSDCLTRQKHKAVLGVLEALLVRKRQAQLVCLDVLERIGDVTAVTALAAVLPGAAAPLLRAFGHCPNTVGGPAQTAVLMHLARQYRSQEQRRQIVATLCRLAAGTGAEATGRICQALNRGDVQASWLGVLGACAQAEDLCRLQAALSHPDAEMRLAVFGAAKHTGAHLLQKTVVTDAGHAHLEVRLLAVRVRQKALQIETGPLVRARLKKLHSSYKTSLWIIWRRSI